MKCNIKQVVLDGLCTGCGLCQGLCSKAIKINLNKEYGTLEPEINENICNSCSLCLAVCPPLTWSSKSKYDLNDRCIGEVKTVHAVNCTDQDIRYSASSGGFVTATLLYLLKTQKISGAILTHQIFGKPLKNELVIARSKTDVLHCMGSKYYPISFNELFSLIKKVNPDERLAIVGLPCHIEGIFNSEEKWKKLRTTIKYKISLVCGGFPSFHAYNYIFKEMKVEPNDVMSISNRGDGWPGNMHITLKNGSDVNFPYGSKYGMGTVMSSPVFRPLACQLCADPYGYNADISVADAWLPEYKKNDKLGKNLVLAKTEAGYELVKEMIEKGTIESHEHTISDFIKANHNVFKKKLQLRYIGLGLLLNKMNRSKYLNEESIIKIDIATKIKAVIYYINIILINKFKISKRNNRIITPLLFYFKIISKIIK